jgi:hypothetical protein
MQERGRVRASGWFVVVSAALAASAGCSSGAFEVAASVDDTGSAGDTGAPALDSSTADSNAGDTGVSDTAVVTVDAIVGNDAIADGPVGGCAPLPAGATDVWVDGRSTVGEQGSSPCPFHTVAAALARVGKPAVKVTIHVRGNNPTAPLVYIETSLLQLPNNVTLLGEAEPGSSVLTGGGSCPSGGQCVVFMDFGSVLDGFVVRGAAGRHAIVTASTPGASSPPPVPLVRNTLATGAASDGFFGIYALGSATFAPGVSASGNGRTGLYAVGPGTILIGGNATAPSHFDNNGGSGIDVNGATVLRTDGLSASNNQGHGVRLGSVGAAQHQLFGLTADGNASSGISIHDTASALVRHGTFTRNKWGLSFAFGNANALDLGASPNLGSNVFGSSVPANRNSVSGLCLSAVNRTIPADGNTWSACAPAQLPTTGSGLVGGCDPPVAGSTYADVLYRGSTIALAPIASSTPCTVGM